MLTWILNAWSGLVRAEVRGRSSAALRFELLADHIDARTADPFADAAEGDDSGKDYVHIRVQQRNGKKSLTTIQVQRTQCTMHNGFC
jgi:hypothetical protein